MQFPSLSARRATSEPMKSSGPGATTVGIVLRWPRTSLSAVRGRQAGGRRSGAAVDAVDVEAMRRVKGRALAEHHGDIARTSSERAVRARTTRSLLQGAAKTTARTADSAQPPVPAPEEPRDVPWWPSRLLRHSESKAHSA